MNVKVIFYFLLTFGIIHPCLTTNASAAGSCYESERKEMESLWINDSNREFYVKHMAQHYKDTKSEDEVRAEVEHDPQVLEEYVDYLANNYEERYEQNK